MIQRLLLAAVLALGVARPAGAQTAVVVSPKPDRISLTVYRAPYGRGAIDLRYLQGFAMITETRKIRLPRGRAVLRFEGVAEGIVPVSAIIDGLPGGTVEKNRDAKLLSPAALIDGTLGRGVTLTRTDRASGRQTSEDATIVAGPTPGVILRTARGIETLRCSGLSERVTFAGAPAGLSNTPVLSVTTDTPTSRTVTVRLTYLASGFDWRASYVGTLAPNGKTLDLFAWLTLANGNPERFPDATVQAVAGRLNREEVARIPVAAADLRLVCYPLGTTTSDLRTTAFEAAEEITVTAGRMVTPVMMMAPPPPPAPAPPPPPPPEDLGDLKLYRVPQPTTVVANGQKQVALLAQPAVPFERRYRREVYPGQPFDAAPTAVVLVVTNDNANGLGIALPAGGTALYARRESGRFLLGLGAMTDRTVGERVRIAAGVSRQVLVSQKRIGPNGAVLTVANANPFAVTLDVPIGAAGQKVEPQAENVNRTDGIVTWTPILPPGGSAELRYRF